MTDKQTICPSCQTTYRVSVPQLTVAQGMVCCPKCDTNFNALLNLIKPESINSSQLEREQKQDYQQPNTSNHPAGTTGFDRHTTLNPSNQNNYSHETEALEIFDRKIENSHIDLRTYLNNLNQFNQDPLTNIPSLNLSSGQSIYRHQNSQLNARNPIYYFFWAIINIVLLLVLIFQILWFNPSLLDRHPSLHSAFYTTCQLLNCDTIDERYKHIRIEQLKVQKTNKSKTQFSGLMLNSYKKSLEVPIIKLTLKSQGKIILEQTISPKEYLSQSLKGINRIPSNAPYKFEFTIDKARNAFDDYQLQIIHP